MAIVDGTEVLKFCRTVGLLTVAVVATVEATTCPPVLFTREAAVLPTLTAADVKTVVGFPPLCEVMIVGVCIGGLTSVTVGTLFTDEITALCALEVEQVRIIVLGVADRTAALPLLTETGPLLTSVTAGCELFPPLSAEAPAVI